MAIEFEHFVGDVRRRSDGRALDAVTCAVGMAEEFGRFGDRLVSHFVAEARDAGLSWAQIGTSLGVTRQAARQRFADADADLAGGRSPLVAPAMGADGLLEKAAPFAAVRHENSQLHVQVEIGGTWYALESLDDFSTGELMAAAQRAFGRRWLKRLSEDLDDVYTATGASLGPTADVTLVDAAGRRFLRTVEVTIAKRKAAWRYNHGPL